MAIGDDLVGGGGLVGPISFTEDMRNRGVRLVPSAGTPPIDPIGPPGRASRIGQPGFPATAADEGRRQRMEGSPRAQILGPEDVRARNPFNPAEFEIPEDDALTPEGVLAPSEIKEQGSALSKLGDFLTNPASGKFLAALGMSLTPSRDDPLGELAIGMAESRAQRQFRAGLEEGQTPGDILVPGLSSEGRQQVQQQFESERAQRVHEEQTAQREERLGQQEERLQGLAELQRQRVQQQIEAGKIDNELGQIKLKSLKAAQEAGGDPTSMFRAGAQAIGLDIPEGVNLEGFTPEQTFSLLDKFSSLEMVRRQMQGVGKDEATSLSMLNEAARQTRIETHQRELNTFRQQLQELPSGRGQGTGGERVELLDQIRTLTDRILELGGDPFAESEPGLSTGTGVGEETSVEDVEIQNIMEQAGLTRAQAEGLTPEERFNLLQKLQSQ